MSDIRICYTGCCKILHWYCRRVFLRTFHAGGVKKMGYIFGASGDMSIWSERWFTYNHFDFSTVWRFAHSRMRTKAEFQTLSPVGDSRNFCFRCHHERHRLNIYRKYVPKRSYWQNRNNLLVLKLFCLSYDFPDGRHTPPFLHWSNIL